MNIMIIWIWWYVWYNCNLEDKYVVFVHILDNFLTAIIIIFIFLLMLSIISNSVRMTIFLLFF